MREAFNKFDEGKKGKLTSEELHDFIQPLERKVEEREISDMMKVIDPDGDGHLDYVEFAMLMGEKIKDEHMEEELEKAYRLLAKKKTDDIDQKLMLRIYKLAGESVKTDEIDRVFKEFGVDTGYMTFKDFIRVMLHK